MGWLIIDACQLIIFIQIELLSHDMPLSNVVILEVKSNVVILEVKVQFYLYPWRANYEGFYMLIRIMYKLRIHIENEDHITVV